MDNDRPVEKFIYQLTFDFDYDRIYKITGDRLEFNLSPVLLLFIFS